ncbi:MAG: hypothetical protein GX410_06610 [Elusimicrobia bacterium]|nr:hypothetical protein [Elusimicrobiota bacterium]
MLTTTQSSKVRAACDRLAREIQARRETALEPHRAPSPATGLTASRLARCSRQAYYALRDWHRQPRLSGEQAARLVKGRREKALALAELLELGFELTAAHIPFPQEAYNRYGIAGRLDAKLRHPLHPRRRAEVPLAVKSLHPLAYAAVNSWRDLKKHHFYCTYYRQAQACIQAFNTNALLLLLSDCLGGWKLLTVPRDEEELASLREMTACVNAALKGGPLPPRMAYHAKVCGRCPFAAECAPKPERRRKRIVAG